MPSFLSCNGFSILDWIWILASKSPMRFPTMFLSSVFYCRCRDATLGPLFCSLSWLWKGQFCWQWASKVWPKKLSDILLYSHWWLICDPVLIASRGIGTFWSLFSDENCTDLVRNQVRFEDEKGWNYSGSHSCLARHLLGRRLPFNCWTSSSIKIPPLLFLIPSLFSYSNTPSCTWKSSKTMLDCLLRHCHLQRSKLSNFPLCALSNQATRDHGKVHQQMGGIPDGLVILSDVRQAHRTGLFLDPRGRFRPPFCGKPRSVLRVRQTSKIPSPAFH